MKIKIKNKLEVKPSFIYQKVKVKRKITLIKKKYQKNEEQIRKKKNTINLI